MPELSRFKGIVIKMYYDDVSQHYKPHVHVFYGDEEAVVGLDGEVGQAAIAPIPNGERLARPA